MTTPNNSSDVIVVKDDNSKTFRTFQHLRAIASKYGSPDIFLTITPDNSCLQYLYAYTGPRVDKE